MLFLLSNACHGAGSGVKQIAVLSLLKRGKKGHHMVLTAVAPSRWKASRAVATILNYCDKFSHSRWGFLCLGLFFWLLLMLFLNRLMCYSHPENNTGQKRLEEGRRNPTWHTDICVTQEQEGVQAQFWKHHTEGCRVEGSFSQSILELPHEDLMMKQQHWHLTQHICTDGDGEATQTCPDCWHSAYTSWEQYFKKYLHKYLQEDGPGLNTP